MRRPSADEAQRLQLPVRPDKIDATVGVDVSADASTGCKATEDNEKRCSGVVRDDLKMHGSSAQTNEKCYKSFVSLVSLALVRLDENRTSVVHSGLDERACGSDSFAREVAHQWYNGRRPPALM